MNDPFHVITDDPTGRLCADLDLERDKLATLLEQNEKQHLIILQLNEALSACQARNSELKAKLASIRTRKAGK